MKFDRSNKFDFLLLWASKFATAKIEWSFEMGKSTLLGVTYILPAMVHANNIYNLQLLKLVLLQLQQMQIKMLLMYFTVCCYIYY